MSHSDIADLYGNLLNVYNIFIPETNAAPGFGIEWPIRHPPWLYRLREVTTSWIASSVTTGPLSVHVVTETKLLCHLPWHSAF